MIATKPSAPTLSVHTNRINQFFNQRATKFSSMYGRWLDESKYENFDDYIEAAKALLPQDFKFVKMTKRPFMMQFSVGTDAVYCIKATSREVTWFRVS